MAAVLKQLVDGRGRALLANGRRLVIVVRALGGRSVRVEGAPKTDTVR